MAAGRTRLKTSCRSSSIDARSATHPSGARAFLLARSTPVESPSLMPTSAAAIWSAIAASCSALTAIFVMLIQRRNLLESVRPELVLTGWSREARGFEGNPEAAHEVITFKTIRNVGRGAAFHVMLNSFSTVDNRPTYFMGSTRLPILAPNETIEVNGEIVLWWKNVNETTPGGRYLPITVSIMHWDSRGMRHVTTYSLMAMELSVAQGCTDEIAPSVMFCQRTTETRAVWTLKVQGKLQSATANWRRRLAARPVDTDGRGESAETRRTNGSRQT